MAAPTPQSLDTVKQETSLTVINSLYGTFTIICIQLLPDYVDSRHQHTNNAVPIYMLIAVLLIFLFVSVKTELKREMSLPDNSTRIQSIYKFAMFSTTLILILVGVGFAGLISRLVTSIQQEQLVHSGPNHIFLWIIILLLAFITNEYFQS